MLGTPSDSAAFYYYYYYFERWKRKCGTRTESLPHVAMTRLAQKVHGSKVHPAPPPHLLHSLPPRRTRSRNLSLRRPPAPVPPPPRRSAPTAEDAPRSGSRRRPSGSDGRSLAAAGGGCSVLRWGVHAAARGEVRSRR
uniref:Uncharacterized protein n=1 Tax=Setaria viridis TaxID=4556 RepID=A0A4U6VNF1_SETVI|nr:hypothetical protein SEVIR_2G094566v2 [Setaria viridis]